MVDGCHWSIYKYVYVVYHSHALLHDHDDDNMFATPSLSIYSCTSILYIILYWFLSHMKCVQGIVSKVYYY